MKALLLLLVFSVETAFSQSFNVYDVARAPLSDSCSIALTRDDFNTALHQLGYTANQLPLIHWSDKKVAVIVSMRDPTLVASKLYPASTDAFVRVLVRATVQSGTPHLSIIEINRTDTSGTQCDIENSSVLSTVDLSNQKSTIIISHGGGAKTVLSIPRDGVTNIGASDNNTDTVIVTQPTTRIHPETAPGKSDIDVDKILRQIQKDHPEVTDSDISKAKSQLDKKTQ